MDGLFYRKVPDRGIQSVCSFSKGFSGPPTTLHWFRIDSLRLSDNPAFDHAVSTGQRLKTIVILDPWFNSNNKTGPGANVWRFLLESLVDLDNRLQKHPYKTRLNVFLGQPTHIIPQLLKKWNVTMFTFQSSQTSLESLKHDEVLKTIISDYNVKPFSFNAHTLYDPKDVLEVNDDKYPTSYKDFRRLLPKLGCPSSPIPEPDPIAMLLNQRSDALVAPPDGQIPTLQDLGFEGGEILYTSNFTGGETEALSRLSSFCSKRIAQSEDPVSWLMSRDTLSPYIRFGCLSVRQIFSQLHQYASTSSKGQSLFEDITKNLLMREFSFLVGMSVPSFDTMVGNPYCIQLPWEVNDEADELLEAWRQGKTGYPWIDACIRQCRREGWAHFTARQSIAVFLTRGYLWVNWERGKEFFQEFMLDFELPLSTICWMQSSCSGFFCDQIESYDPCYIGKQMDQEGNFIKHFVPELKDYPSSYIHQPWSAPDYVQKQANCIIGKNYPKPIVDVCDQGELCCRRIKSVLTALHEVYGAD